VKVGEWRGSGKTEKKLWAGPEHSPEQYCEQNPWARKCQLAKNLWKDCYLDCVELEMGKLEYRKLRGSEHRCRNQVDGGFGVDYRKMKSALGPMS